MASQPQRALVSESGHVDAIVAPLTWDERLEQMNQMFRAKRIVLERAPKVVARIDEAGRDVR